VCLWTPACSAMALMVVRRGPMVLCNSTVASTILWRVCFWRSALRFITYFRAIYMWIKESEEPFLEP
jgi:hypothetical protein